MAFKGILFEESVGGTVAVVSSNWLTPRKQAVQWPPYKTQDQYDKALKKAEKPCDTWEVYPISKIFFECDDFTKAQRKIKRAELTSDVQSSSDGEEELPPSTKRRIRTVPKQLYESDSTPEKNEARSLNSKELNFKRPPIINDLGPILDSNVPLIRATNKNTPVSENTIPQYRSPTTSFTLNNVPLTSDASNNNRVPLTQKITLQSNSPTLSSISHSDNRQINILLEVREQNKQILEQNKQILDLLKKNTNNTTYNLIPTDLPHLPLRTQEEIDNFETYLSDIDKEAAVCSYLATIGGKDVVSRVNNALRRCLSNSVAAVYSFFGKRDKKPFSTLRLNRVIIGSVKSGLPGTTEREIEDAIKVWLKHSPQRMKGESKKQK